MNCLHPLSVRGARRAFARRLSPVAAANGARHNSPASEPWAVPPSSKTDAHLAEAAVASREHALLLSLEAGASRGSDAAALGASILTHLEAGIVSVEAAAVAADAASSQADAALRRHKEAAASLAPADILRAAVQPPVTPPLRVRFEVVRRVRYGHAVAVVGSSPELGAWDAAQALRLRWTPGNVWMAEPSLKLGPGVAIAYKYVELDSQGQLSEWAPGPDWRLSLSPRATDADVRCADTWASSTGRPERVVTLIAPAAGRKGGGRVAALRQEIREEKARSAALRRALENKTV